MMVSEEECQAMDGMKELQILINRKKWLRRLKDVRLRIKCLKKNNGISDHNEDIAEATLTLLGEEKKLNAEKPIEENGLICTDLKIKPMTEDNDTAAKEIDIEDAEFDPQELSLERVRPVGSGVLFQPPLPHSRPWHQGTSRVLVRTPWMVESDLTVGEKVDQFVDAESYSVGQGEKSLVRGLKDVLSTTAGEECWTHEVQALEDGANRSHIISSNKHKCLSTRDGECVFRSSSLPAHTMSRGSSWSVKKSYKSSTVQPEEDCTLCNRRPSLVTCTSPVCGLSFKGRLATWCPQHPSNCYLMDHPDICPGCNSTLVEHELSRDVAMGVLTLSRRDMAGQSGIRVQSKTDREPATDKPGTRVLKKTDRAPATGQPGPLLSPVATVGRASFVKSGSGEFYRERVKRVKNVVNTKQNTGSRDPYIH